MTEESEAFKNLCVATSSSIQSHVRALAGISPDDANLVISKILNLRLLAAHKQDIVGAINEKVWLAYQDPTEEPNLKQGIDEPEIFLTEDDWDILRSPTSSMRDRVGRLATRFGSLGLWYPTETAVRCVVTLAFLDRGTPWASWMWPCRHRGPSKHLPRCVALLTRGRGRICRTSSRASRTSRQTTLTGFAWDTVRLAHWCLCQFRH